MKETLEGTNDGFFFLHLLMDGSQCGGWDWVALTHCFGPYRSQQYLELAAVGPSTSNSCGTVGHVVGLSEPNLDNTDEAEHQMIELKCLFKKTKHWWMFCALSNRIILWWTICCDETLYILISDMLSVLTGIQHGHYIAAISGPIWNYTIMCT